MDEIAALVEPHIPGLRRYAYALLRDGASADDLVQDCLERVVSRWHLRRADGDLRAWLFTILRNRFRRVVGRRRAAPETSADEMPDHRHAVPAFQEATIEVQAFRRAFAKLDWVHREVLLLVGFHGLAYHQVAEICGCELGTVKSRLHRARELLKRLLLAESGAPRGRNAAAGARPPGAGEGQR